MKSSSRSGIEIRSGFNAEIQMELESVRGFKEVSFYLLFVFMMLSVVNENVFHDGYLVGKISMKYCLE